MEYFTLSLNYAERQWLVSNFTREVTGESERALILGVYLTTAKTKEEDYSIDLELHEEQLWILDKLISSSAPFTTSLASGERLYTLGEKVWYHLARLHCTTPLFRPEEALNAPDNSNDDSDTDTYSTGHDSEHATVRRAGYH